MKKFIYLFLAVTMTAFLFGCGEDSTTNDTSNDSGNTPVCKNGVVCPEEQPKTDKGQTKEFKLTFNTTGKGNKIKAEIDLPDANMFKFNSNKGKCSVMQQGTKVYIQRSDNPICDVYYTFTAPQDANANTDLKGKYVLYSGNQVSTPTEAFTVKHPLVTTNDTTQGGQSIDGIIIEPAPKDNVITMTPDSNGVYSITFTNGTLVNGNATPESSDIFFQFDWDLNGINASSIELIESETTCPGERTLFYKRLDKKQSRRSCKITYKINENKKDTFMKHFIVIKNPGSGHTYDPNNTKGATITIKNQ